MTLLPGAPASTCLVTMIRPLPPPGTHISWCCLPVRAEPGRRWRPGARGGYRRRRCSSRPPNRPTGARRRVPAHDHAFRPPGENGEVSRALGQEPEQHVLADRSWPGRAQRHLAHTPSPVPPRAPGRLPRPARFPQPCGAGDPGRRTPAAGSGQRAFHGRRGVFHHLCWGLCPPLRRPVLAGSVPRAYLPGEPSSNSQVLDARPQLYRLHPEPRCRRDG